MTRCESVVAGNPRLYRPRGGSPKCAVAFSLGSARGAFRDLRTVGGNYQLDEQCCRADANTRAAAVKLGCQSVGKHVHATGEMSGGGEQYADLLRWSTEPDAAETFVQLANPLTCPSRPILRVAARFAPRRGTPLRTAAEFEGGQRKGIATLEAGVLRVANGGHGGNSVQREFCGRERPADTRHCNCSQRLTLLTVFERSVPHCSSGVWQNSVVARFVHPNVETVM